MMNNNFDSTNQTNNDFPQNNDYMTPIVGAATNIIYQTENNGATSTEEKNNEDVKNDFSLPTTLEDYLVFSKNFYAGFWLRFVAFLIDSIVILSLTGLLNTITFNTLNIELHIPILGVEVVSYAIVMFTYYILMTYYFSQTLGKMIMKIKVETNKGEKPTLGSVIFREFVGKLLNIGLFYLPYLVLPFTNKKKGLHDYIADTVVVKEDFSKLRRKMNEKLESMR